MNRFLLIAVIAILATLSLSLSQTLEGNWDEYNFLSKVHLLASGKLSQPLQTFHVHLFSWLTAIADHALDRILAARIVVWLVWIGTLFLLHQIGRRFLSPTGALFALACLASFSFVIEHAASFRYDTLALGFVVLSAWLFGHRSALATLASGVALAVAGLVTIKSALLLPPWIGLAIPLIAAQGENDQFRSGVHKVALAAIGAVAGGGILFTWHWLQLDQPTATAAGTTITAGATKTLVEAGLWPRLDYLLRAIQENPGFWLALVAGAATLVPAFFRECTGRRVEAASLLLLLFPIATLALYRNAFPYFYVFCLPLPALLCGRAYDFLRHGEGGRSRLGNRGYLLLSMAATLAAMGLQQTATAFWFVPLLCIPVFLLDWHQSNLTDGQRRILAAVFAIAILAASLYGAIDTWRTQSSRSTQPQRSVLEAVHTMFPEPVAYIDRCSMVSAYPQSGFFMSTWGMQNYRAAGQPILRTLVQSERPRFLLANHPALDLDRPLPENLGLLREDVEFLQANFVHAWGPIWVAGRRMNLDADGAMEFDILVPGPYILETDHPVRIDGETLNSGTQVELEAGRHRIESTGSDSAISLKLATGPKPERTPPEGYLFNGFGRP